MDTQLANLIMAKNLPGLKQLLKAGKVSKNMDKILTTKKVFSFNFNFEIQFSDDLLVGNSLAAQHHFV